LIHINKGLVAFVLTIVGKSMNEPARIVLAFSAVVIGLFSASGFPPTAEIDNARCPSPNPGQVPRPGTNPRSRCEG
jgi:hypothetical protein